MIEQRLWFDPEDGIGKRCAVCGREHFNEGEFCSRCLDRMTDYE